MAHRINVMIDDDLWEQLQTVPAGERSRLVNRGLSTELLRRQRQAAMEQMQALRQEGLHCGAAAEELIRMDRERHG